MLTDEEIVKIRHKQIRELPKNYQGDILLDFARAIEQAVKGEVCHWRRESIESDYETECGNESGIFWVGAGTIEYHCKFCGRKIEVVFGSVLPIDAAMTSEET